ncbi:MAG: hypothetical protein JWN23_970 [Rhodocyclales bacterium]|nr:hypothetical protein [Rhodocyclales bacterium]
MAKISKEAYRNSVDLPRGFRLHTFLAQQGVKLAVPARLMDQLLAEVRATIDAEVAALEEEEAAAERLASKVNDAPDDASHDASGADSQPPRLPIFDIAKIDAAWDALPPSEREKSGLITLSLLAARRDKGERLALAARTTLAALLDNLSMLQERMPNFAAAIDALAVELALAFATDVDRFHVTPILLHGGAGIGKTLFATELAKCLNTSFEKISMGAMSAGFELAGAARAWGSARAGRISKLLADGEDASPVVLLDEIDKLGSDLRYPAEPVLLDLLEPDSAKCFRDEFMEVTLDASRIIFIATANDIECMSAPLRSRMRIIEIETPTSEQRCGIVARLLDRHRQDYGVDFLPEVGAALSHQGFDLRRLRQVVREAAGRALMNGKERPVRLEDLRLPQEKLAAPMGFV